MAEYKSFHYQMHQVPEPIKPHYLQAPKALKFSELYSPRNDNTITMGKHERSFWRTRDRIEFEIYENRKNEVVFITCHNLDNQEVYRTIFLHADVLYFEVEAKAREDGSREKILRKRDKQFYSDELLYKAVCDYILTRLNITTDLVLWPDFVVPEPVDYANMPTKPSTPNPHDLELHDLTFSPVEPSGPLEKMVTFSKVFSDKYLYLEINKPAGLNLDGIPFVKTEAGPLVAIPVHCPSPVKPAPASAPAPEASEAAAGGLVVPAPINTSDVPPATSGSTTTTPGTKKATPKSSKGVTSLPLIPSGLKSGTATGTATPAAGSLPSTARVDIPLLVIPGSNTATPHSTPSAAAHKTASASPSGVATAHSGSAHTTPMNAKKITPSGKSAPLAKGRSSVLVKHNNTPVSAGKSASATNLGANATGPANSAGGGAGMVGSASTATVGNGVVLPAITTASPRLAEVKVSGTPANTPAHVNTAAKTTTTTPTASAPSTTANTTASTTGGNTDASATPTSTSITTAEKKKANPSPMNARHSIINKNNNKVAST